MVFEFHLFAIEIGQIDTYTFNYNLQLISSKTLICSSHLHNIVLSWVSSDFCSIHLTRVSIDPKLSIFRTTIFIGLAKFLNFIPWCTRVHSLIPARHRLIQNVVVWIHLIVIIFGLAN